MCIKNGILIFLHIYIGLSDTLAMWRCVLLLLQNEDLVVRDAAAEVLQVAQTEKKSTNGSGMLTSLLNNIGYLRD